MNNVKKLSAEDQRTSDLLCNAFEGGSNYWYMIHRTVDGEGGKMEFPHLEIPFRKGGQIWIGADDHKSDRKDGLWLLDRKAIEKGWKLMQGKKWVHHYADAIAENDDVTTGDVFLQLCLFGDVIFG